MLGGHHVVNGWRCESRPLTRNQQQYDLHHFWFLCDDFPDHALLEPVRGSGNRKLQLGKRKAKSQQFAARDRKEMDRCANHDLLSQAYFKDQHYRPAVCWLYDPTLLKSKVWQVHHDHDYRQHIPTGHEVVRLEWRDSFLHRDSQLCLLCDLHHRGSCQADRLKKEVLQGNVEHLWFHCGHRHLGCANHSQVGHRSRP
jgi:hypothetical protein